MWLFTADKARGRENTHTHQTNKPGVVIHSRSGKREREHTHTHTKQINLVWLFTADKARGRENTHTHTHTPNK